MMAKKKAGGPVRLGSRSAELVPPGSTPRAPRQPRPTVRLGGLTLGGTPKTKKRR